MELIANLYSSDFLVARIGVDGIGVGRGHEHSILEVWGACDVTAVDIHVVVTVDVIVGTSLDVTGKESLCR